MSDPTLGVDPTPTPPHPLVAQSDALDVELNHSGIADALKADRKRQASFARRITIVVLVMLVQNLVVVYALFGIAHNAGQIEGERRARHVFCIETNFNNAEARTALINAFPTARDPAVIRNIAGLLFPTRDCSQDPPIVIDTIDVSPLPVPLSTNP